MKKIVLCFLMTVAFAAMSNQAAAQIVQGANIKFENDVHDYGDIKKGSDGICYFEFTNTGTEPLVIASAKGSCGCTVPVWPKDPIAPGATEKIKVDYNADLVGPINKSVTIVSNSVEEPVKVVRIRGNVLPPAEGASPVDNSGAPASK